MFYLIYQVNEYFLFFFLFLLFLSISWLLLFVFNRFLPANYLKGISDYTNFLNTSVSFLYAIILGFIILYELDNYHQIQQSEETEAQVISSIYHYSILLPDTLRNTVQSNLVNYIETVLTNWKVMAEGKPPSVAGRKILFGLLQHLSRTSLPANNFSIEKISEYVDQLMTIDELRDHFSKVAVLSSDIWLLIWISTALFLILQCCYGSNLVPRYLGAIAMALLIASVTYLVISLDRPYMGKFSVQPNSIKSVLHFISTDRL